MAGDAFAEWPRRCRHALDGVHASALLSPGTGRKALDSLGLASWMEVSVRANP
jgi:hypothetical protein